MPHEHDENAELNENLTAPEAEEMEIIESPEPPAAEVDTVPVAPAAAHVEHPAPAAAEVPAKAPRSFGSGIKEASVNGLNFSDRALKTRALLLKEKRVNVILPLIAGEKRGAYKVVNINGYRLEIQKQTPVEVPLSVWNIIAENMKASIEAPANHPLNLNNADKGTKVALGLV